MMDTELDGIAPAGGNNAPNGNPPRKRYAQMTVPPGVAGGHAENNAGRRLGEWGRRDGGAGAQAGGGGVHGGGGGAGPGMLRADVPGPVELPLPSSAAPLRPPPRRAQGARLMIKGTHPAVPERRIHALASDFGVVGKIEVLEVRYRNE